MEKKVVSQFLKIKLKIGNRIFIFKNVKSVMLLYKKYQVVIMSLVQYVVMNGAGSVGHIILIFTSVHLILSDVQACRISIVTARYLFTLKEYYCFC